MINIPFNVYDLEYFLLILVRVSAMLALSPIFGARNIPLKIKAGLSIFLSLIIFQTIKQIDLNYTTMIGYSIIIIKEMITGLLIGFFANICMTIISFAGQMIDIDIGFSMATLFDPMNQVQETVSGNLYNYFILLMMLATNMHFFIIRALVDSFSVVPIGGILYKPDHMYRTFLQFMSDYMVIGFRIILPIFATILILNVVLGVLAKVAPQMNMFVIGLQLKVFFGFAVLIVTIIFLPNISEFVFSEMEKMVNLVIKGMY